MEGFVVLIMRKGELDLPPQGVFESLEKAREFATNKTKATDKGYWQIGKIFLGAGQPAASFEIVDKGPPPN